MPLMRLNPMTVIRSTMLVLWKVKLPKKLVSRNEGSLRNQMERFLLIASVESTGSHESKVPTAPLAALRVRNQEGSWDARWESPGVLSPTGLQPQTLRIGQYSAEKRSRRRHPTGGWHKDPLTALFDCLPRSRHLKVLLSLPPLSK